MNWLRRFPGASIQNRPQVSTSRRGCLKQKKHIMRQERRLIVADSTARATIPFYVPFENIGVKVVGKSYAKDEDFRYDTMVHELTHQMMHFWLNALPQWVTEGTAEYTSNLPLRTGKFRLSAAKNGLKDYVDYLKKESVGGVPQPYPLEKLFRVNNAEWAEILASSPGISRRLYFTSYLLVYYFMHLDGKGDGERFVRYFREIGELRKSNPRLDEGSASTALNLLLDGRTEADLMKQIRSSYAKLGIRL
jgi:hypothetical protein